MSGGESSPPARPIFDPVDTSFDPTDVTARDDVESPSLSSSNALARFEFEPGKSKEGTKVLMVEWEDDATTAEIRGDWEISWEGKRTVLPARETPTAEGQEAPVNRLYFLLGPGVSIPTNVKLQKGSVVWRTNPLPAIFSPELGATATQAGKRGVLHTIWAKKRLQVLQREIENESKENVEGIGLEMAVAEKDWIEQNFGVAARPTGVTIPPANAMASVNFDNGPASPRSPGGRLMDKLKGLKVGTTQQELQGKPDFSQHNPLSPETSDVAVGSIGSFAAIKGIQPTRGSPQSSMRNVGGHNTPVPARLMQSGGGGMASLNALSQSGTGAISAEPADDKQDDLFALPMSPRTDQTGSSPFTFAPQDTMRYLKGEKA